MKLQKVDIRALPGYFFRRRVPEPGDIVAVFETYEGWKLNPLNRSNLEHEHLVATPDRRKGSRRSPAFGRRFSDKAGECNTGNRRTRFDRRAPGVPPRVPDDECVVRGRHQVRLAGDVIWQEIHAVQGRSAGELRASAWEVRYKEAQ